MSTTRRSLLALIAGGLAALATRAKAAPIAPLSTVVDPDVVKVMGWETGPRFGILYPRGTVLGMDGNAFSITLISTGNEWVPADSPEGRAAALYRRMSLPPDLEASYPRGATFGDRWISTGEIFVEVDSPEGEAIALERAVNLRSDGTIRHRQHHWPRD